MLHPKREPPPGPWRGRARRRAVGGRGVGDAVGGGGAASVGVAGAGFGPAQASTAANRVSRTRAGRDRKPGGCLYIASHSLWKRTSRSACRISIRPVLVG